MDQVRDDERVMSVVESALALPTEERERYVRSACSGDPELFSQVWNYIQREEQMHGFLLQPLYSAGAAEHFFQPGEVLDGRFLITRLVAHGGMGVVYEAVDQKLERRIALKCAKVGFGKRLPPEVRHASEISHPNVCKIFEIHTAATPQGEIDFITMEFLEGETLFRRLLRGPLPEAEARAVAMQLCAGLAEAHRNGVIHGDLKTINVILTTGTDGQPRAVITDFGLARRRVASSAVKGEIAGGTPGYIAPELWRGEAPSVASDIFALGVILHEMLAARKPHEKPVSDSSPTVTATVARSSDPLFWQERLKRKPAPVHPKWDGVLARCLDSEPSRRFKSADEVMRALGPSHSRRWFLIAAGAVVLAAISGLITYERTAAPKEEVRLAVLPFEGDAGNLVRDAAGEISGLSSSSRTRFKLIRQETGATHVLHGTLTSSNGHMKMHAILTDARTHVNTRDWTVDYGPGEVRYAPVALAGMVSWTFRLPALSAKAAMHANAVSDYQAGLEHLRNVSGGLDAALELFAKAAAADPDSALPQAGLAEAEWFKYYQTQDKAWLERATESVRQAEMRNPDLGPVRRIAGRLKVNSGRYEQAAADYRRAIELNPRDSDAYRRLGRAYASNSQLDEALAAYQKAVEIDPAYYGNHLELGSFYFERGNFSEALRHRLKAVELAPGEANTHFALAMDYQFLGQFEDAEREFRSSIGIKPTWDAVNGLGIALMYQGKDRDAIPYFQTALQLNPQAYVPWMYLGVAYRRIQQPAGALEANRRGVELSEAWVASDPRSGYHRSVLAFVCAQLSDRGRAQSEIAQALQLSPSDADTHIMAALTYEALGEREATLGLAASLPAEQLARLNRWPDVEDLRKDPRFLRLLVTNPVR